MTALHESSLYFTRSEIGSQWSCCRRGVQFFDGVVLCEQGVQQYFGLSASAE